MHFFMIPVFMLVVIVQYSTGKGYSAGGSAIRGGILSGGGYIGGVRPTPYNMGYEAPDEQGNVHFRQEEGDGNGNVHGSYGYRDSQGLYRIVRYTAGPAGYRAVVRTNEPGTDGKESPADVQMMVEQTPAGIQEQYSRQSGMGSGYMMGGERGGISLGGYNPFSRGAKSGKLDY